MTRLVGIACIVMIIGLLPYVSAQEPVVNDGETQGGDSRILAQVDRKIAKQPAYRQAPKYCLVVFGKKATHRVWLVLDGDTLYVDRKGNGDLTEKGEAHNLADGKTLAVGDIVDGQTRLTHEKLEIYRWGKNHFQIYADASFEEKRMPRLFGRADAELADSPEKAPIVHFGGPLQMDMTVATIGGRPSFLCAEVGTPGVGKGTFVSYTHSVFDVQKGKIRQHPIVEIEYDDTQNGRVHEKSAFYTDAFLRLYLLPVTGGKKDDKRKSTIKLSFDDWPNCEIAPRTIVRPFLKLDVKNEN